MNTKFRVFETKYIYIGTITTVTAEICIHTLPTIGTVQFDKIH